MKAKLKKASRNMSTKELAAIRKRCDEATPGPWKYYGNEHDHPNPSIEYRNSGVAARGEGDFGGFKLMDDRWWNDESGRMENRIQANANFIAHARTDIPKLLNEIKILQEEVNRLKNAE